MHSTIALALLLPACQFGDIEVSGTVLDGRDRDAAPLADAVVEILDDEAGVHASTTTLADGTFQLPSPRSQTLYMSIESPDGTLTSFSGVAGTQSFDVPKYLLDACDDLILVEGGAPVPSLYATPADEVDAIRQKYAGCPGADSSGGVIEGWVRYFLFAHDENQERIEGQNACFLDEDSFVPPVVRNPVVAAEPLDGGDALSACYLDPEGSAYDPTATDAGASQQFAIFGVPEGRYTVVVTFNITDTAFTQGFYNVWVPADGVVPRHPLWVEFPGPS